MPGQSITAYLKRGALTPLDAYYRITSKTYAVAAFRIGKLVKVCKPNTAIFNKIMDKRPNLFIGVYNQDITKEQFFDDL